MKKLLVILLSLFLFGTAYSQKTDSVKIGWTPAGVLSLNLSQVGFTNWSQGGDNALAFTFIGNFGLIYTDTKWTFDNTLKLSFGKSKQGNQSSRTSDNEVFMDNMLSYNLGSPWEPYASNTLRTVIANGFNYDAQPEVQISAFWDPGYLNQGLGVSYKGISWLKPRLGLGFKETFASKFAAQYTDDPTTTKLEKTKFETGIEFVAKAEYAFEENLLLKSEMFLFSAFDRFDVWDVRWDNTITAKISKLFNVNFNVLIVYDKNQSLKTQVKEALQLGITYTIF